MKKILNKNLEETEYALEISNKEISEVNLSFIENTNENGEQIITIELNGTDYDGNFAGISMDLRLSLDELSEYNEEPSVISERIIEGNSYVMRPEESDYSELFIYLPKHNIEDMMNDLTSLWIAKINDVQYMFKFSVPLEGVFTYFKINLTEFEIQE